MSDPSEYGPPLRGTVRWPRPGSPGSYGYARTPSHHHQGIDLVAPEGRPWLAVADGTIVRVATVPTPGFRGYGKIAVLRHKDESSGEYLYILYAHGQSVTVRVGQHVRRGHELGKVGRSQFARRPTRPEGSMGAHLHLEVSRAPYPQGSEAPTRMDPYALLHGAVPGVPRPVARETTPTPDEQLVAKRDLRLALIQRVVETDVATARFAAQLRAQGHDVVAGLLLGAWSEARARIYALLLVPSRLEQIRDAVRAWLADLDTLAARARTAAPSLADTIETARATLAGIWSRGIDWAESTLGQLATQAARIVVGGSATLLLLIGLLALTKKS